MTSSGADGPDGWTSGAAYEAYIGRWSRPIATSFLAWLARPAGGLWIDVGCGTGALTAAVLADADPSEILGVDPSPGFLKEARARITDPRARFLAGTADVLPIPDVSVDTAVSGLVLNFVPEPAAMLGEMRRVTAAGGVVGAYVWDYADGMTLLRGFWDAAVALDPAAAAQDEGGRFPICAPEPLAAAARAARLEDVEVTALEIDTVFRDFDDYWRPFLAATGPAPSYVAALDAEQRTALRDSLGASLPIAADGSIALRARAWAVRGTA